MSTYSRYRRRIAQSTMVRLGRRHLAFAVPNCVLNLRFPAATVGRCGDGWKLRRVAGEAHNMTKNALSILILIFSVQLQQTQTSDRKLFIFHLGRTLIRCDDIGTRCGDVCVWHGDVGDCAEVIRCDDIGAR